MIQIHKSIFGRVYRLTATGSYQQLLKESTDLYPNAPADSFDVAVLASDERDDEKPISQNPKIFQQYAHGFVTDFGRVSIRWEGDLSRTPKIQVRLTDRRNMYRLDRRWRSIEFSTLVEYFEQVLHELVLVPSTFFAPDRVPLHAAAVSVHGRAVLVSGTGGTGKTSAMLALRNEPGVSFLSDDICIVSREGAAFAHLAWPKIYGYNASDVGLRDLLLERRGWVDRLHFHLRRRVTPARVRRKVQPHRLYRSIETASVPLGTLLILSRGNVDRMQVTPLDVDQAVQMSIAVMHTEYFSFFRFLLWKEFNDVLAGRRASPFEEVLDRWRSTLRAALANCQVYAVRIPLQIPHAEYVSRVRDIVLGKS